MYFPRINSILFFLGMDSGTPKIEPSRKWNPMPSERLPHRTGRIAGGGSGLLQPAAVGSRVIMKKCPGPCSSLPSCCCFHRDVGGGAVIWSFGKGSTGPPRRLSQRKPRPPSPRSSLWPMAPLARALRSVRAAIAWGRSAARRRAKVPASPVPPMGCAYPAAGD